MAKQNYKRFHGKNANHDPAAKKDAQNSNPHHVERRVSGISALTCYKLWHALLPTSPLRDYLLLAPSKLLSPCLMALHRGFPPRLFFHCLLALNA
jgi:hypothetical protein